MADYYHQLEGGLLERGVDRRVWDALAETFKTRVEDLVAWRPPPAEPVPMYLRATRAPAAMAPLARPAAAEIEPDEIDELFLFAANK